MAPKGGTLLSPEGGTLAPGRRRGDVGVVGAGVGTTGTGMAGAEVEGCRCGRWSTMVEAKGEEGRKGQRGELQKIVNSYFNDTLNG